jgi:hypothetical protein
MEACGWVSARDKAHPVHHTTPHHTRWRTLASRAAVCQLPQRIPKAKRMHRRRARFIDHKHTNTHTLSGQAGTRLVGRRSIVGFTTSSSRVPACVRCVADDVERASSSSTTRKASTNSKPSKASTPVAPLRPVDRSIETMRALLPVLLLVPGADAVAFSAAAAAGCAPSLATNKARREPATSVYNLHPSQVRYAAALNSIDWAAASANRSIDGPVIQQHPLKRHPQTHPPPHRSTWCWPSATASRPGSGWRARLGAYTSTAANPGRSAGTPTPQRCPTSSSSTTPT